MFGRVEHFPNTAVKIYLPGLMETELEDQADFLAYALIHPVDSLKPMKESQEDNKNT